MGPPDPKKMRHKDDVVIAVEATAICKLDLDSPETRRTYVLGSNFVGEVKKCSEYARECGIDRGSRVAGVFAYGSNDRQVSMPAEKLVLVPENLDSADVACVLSTYLPSFQALHHVRPRPYRYSPSCLKGRKVLVTGGASLEAQATIQLALAAGASQVFVTVPKKSAHQYIHSRHITVLGENPDEWLPIVTGRMDVVVDHEFPKDFMAVKKSLNRKGRLVCHSAMKEGYSWVSEVEYILEQSAVSMMKRATIFDFLDHIESNPEEFESDLLHLFGLLKRRKIRPSVERIIGQKGIPRALAQIQEDKCMAGAIICHPSKK